MARDLAHVEKFVLVLLLATIGAGGRRLFLVAANLQIHSRST